MKFRCILPVLMLCAASLQAQVAVTTYAPDMTYSRTAMRYDPAPYPVTVTLRNTGAVAVGPVSVRIELLAPFTLDSSEQGAVIKPQTPAVIAPNDSLRLTWNLQHPLLLTAAMQRVTFHVKVGPADSSSHSINIPIPPADPPRLSLHMYGIDSLTAKPDSSGYNNNPAEARIQIYNSGGTRVDSLRLQLNLPPGFVLDPPGQPNPIVLQTLYPPPAGDPRLQVFWKIRYTKATRAGLNDSAVVTAAGRDIAGGPVTGSVSTPVHVDGLAPAYEIELKAPDSLAYDTGSVYAPNPMRVAAILRNTGEQIAGLGSLRMSPAGGGASTKDSLSRFLPDLGPGDSVAFEWDMDIERRSFPHSITWTATAVDDDGFSRSASAQTSVPGRAHSLSIQDLSFPDTLALTPDRTAYQSRVIELRFRVHNDNWTNARLVELRCVPAGTGILPNGPVSTTPGDLLGPGDTSGFYSIAYRALGASPARGISFELCAVASTGDTGCARVSVFVPALESRVSLDRRGPDSLSIDQQNNAYSPNPFEQLITLNNLGAADIKLDSAAMDVFGDGVERLEDRGFFFGVTVPPAQGRARAWTFRVEKRTRPRKAVLAYSAWYEGAQMISDTAEIFIPGFEPLLSLETAPLPEILFDSVSIHSPSRVQFSVLARNTGGIAFALDSMELALEAPWTLEAPAVTVSGAVLQPGDSARFEWGTRFVPALFNDSLFSVFNCTAHYDGGRRSSRQSVAAIPGRPTSLRIDAAPPSRLTARADGAGYEESPLATVFSVYNDSWVTRSLSGTSTTVSGDGFTARTPLVRTMDAPISPYGYFHTDPDTFDVEAARTDRTVTLTFGAALADGSSAARSFVIDIPGIEPPAGAGFPPAADAALLPPYPNPASPQSGIVVVPYALLSRGRVRIEAYNALGSRAAVIVDCDADAGEHRAFWDASNMPAGVYLLRMEAGGAGAGRIITLERR